MFDVCLFVPSREEIVDQWTYVFNGWYPDQIYVFGTPVNPYPDYHIFKKAKFIMSMNDFPEDKEIVYMNPYAETSLYDFKHPTNPIYMFGRDDGDFQFTGTREIEHQVRIPTTESELFSHVAGGITLYDRAHKLNG